MDGYTKQIFASGGNWTETEILGNRAIVKVRATQEILNTLDTVFKRLPKDRLDDSLADLSQTIKQKLKNELLDMGYTIEELQERFPKDLSEYTLRDVLKFATKRRLKPRYDAKKDEIFVDGIEQRCRPIESVDEEIQE